MKRDRYETFDILFENENARQMVEQFQTAVTEINSALANALPRSRAVVTTLYEQGREKEAEAIARDVREILNRAENLSKTGRLLLTESQKKMFS